MPTWATIIGPLIASLIADAIQAENEGRTKQLRDQVANLEAERQRQMSADKAFDDAFGQ